ncbi:MAG: endonuclease/exonuclease/phosphatase family protein [Halieaceae bacterium]|nr:endonuclease/exonuclease/phosphatase family protein [Halieaceae bacterium]
MPYYAFAITLLLLAAAVSQAEDRCSADPHWQDGQALAPEFDLLSWNIQKAGSARWAEDLQALAEGVELTLLQEASLQAGIPSLLPERLTAVFAPGFKTNTMNTGVMTLGVAAPTTHCSYSALEPWLGTPKAASVSTYALSGRDDRLLAVNLHAINFSLGLGSLRRQLQPLIAQLADHEGPALAAGDFNTWSAARQSLVDTLMASQGLSRVEFIEDLRSKPFGRPLDHVYLRGLTAERAEVVAVESSDHNPIRLRLAVSP